MKKVVLISGGSDGLGLETARILLPDYTVVILSPTEEKLAKTASELMCDFEVCDVAREEDVAKTIGSVIAKHGRIDCLINNAGLFIQGELTENNSAHIERVLDVNVLGTILLTQAVVPQMKKQQAGLIINVISQGGLYGKAERSVYTASKFAVTGFTKSMEPELKKYGIKVTGIYPGKMNTGMFAKMGIEKDMSDALDPKEVARTIAFVLSLGADTVFTAAEIKHIRN